MAKERASRTYRVSAYFLTKTLVDLPRTVISNAIYVVILYWMVGLRPDAGYFFLFMLTVILSSLAAESLGYMVAAFARNPQEASAISPLFLCGGGWGGILHNSHALLRPGLCPCYSAASSFR